MTAVAATKRRDRLRMRTFSPQQGIPFSGEGHTGLLVPQSPGAQIRVVQTTRGWEQGKVLAFDDSFEHEVWFDAPPNTRRSVKRGFSLKILIVLTSSGERLVLIVDVWHPDISEAKKKLVPQLS